MDLDKLKEAIELYFYLKDIDQLIQSIEKSDSINSIDFYIAQAGIESKLPLIDDFKKNAIELISAKKVDILKQIEDL